MIGFSWQDLQCSDHSSSRNRVSKFPQVRNWTVSMWTYLIALTWFSSDNGQEKFQYYGVLLFFFNLSRFFDIKLSPLNIKSFFKIQTWRSEQQVWKLEEEILQEWEVKNKTQVMSSSILGDAQKKAVDTYLQLFLCWRTQYKEIHL